MNAGENVAAEVLAETEFTVVEGELDRTLAMLLPTEEAWTLCDDAPATDWDPSALLRTDNAFVVVVDKPDPPSLGTVIEELPTGTTIGMSRVVSVTPKLLLVST